MGRIRISGIVRVANRLREALTRRVSTDEQRTLREAQQESLQQIDAILKQHRALPGDLPAPSRQAYEFIRAFDASRLRTAHAGASRTQTSIAAQPPNYAPPPSPPPKPPSMLKFPGLGRFATQLMNDIARLAGVGQFSADATGRVIRQTARRLQLGVDRAAEEEAEIPEATRHLVAWFRYFAQDDRMTHYAEVVEQSRRRWVELGFHDKGWPRPLLIHFRPARSVYRCRVTDEGTQVVLATPLLVADARTLEQVGRRLLDLPFDWDRVMQAMQSEAYLALNAQLDALGGHAPDETAGATYDLAEIFDTVNRTYFEGNMPRPKLTWSKTLTHAKFGHYNYVDDTVMISASLDQPSIPRCAIEHVMHHELLHKKHGMRQQGSRGVAHTPEFREEEKRFDKFDDACRFLERYAREHTR